MIRLILLFMFGSMAIVGVGDIIAIDFFGWSPPPRLIMHDAIFGCIWATAAQFQLWKAKK